MVPVCACGVVFLCRLLGGWGMSKRAGEMSVVREEHFSISLQTRPDGIVKPPFSEMNVPVLK